MNLTISKATFKLVGHEKVSERKFLAVSRREVIDLADDFIATMETMNGIRFKKNFVEYESIHIASAPQDYTRLCVMQRELIKLYHMAEKSETRDRMIDMLEFIIIDELIDDNAESTLMYAFESFDYNGKETYRENGMDMCNRNDVLSLIHNGLIVLPVYTYVEEQLNK